MIIDVELKRGKDGKVEATPSAYRPSDAVKQRTEEVMKDFETGLTIQRTPYREFNDMTVIERQAYDQALFNTYRPPKGDDPAEDWKSNAKRPITRNRAISIAAHVTGALIFPQIFAQNQDDEEDKDAANVMRDLVEWAADQSDYAENFLYAVIAALVNPAVIIHTEFARHMKKQKDIKENGSWEVKEVLDEVLSGFKEDLVPIDELLIGDIRERNMQRQPFLVRRRAIDFSIAKAKYGQRENFAHVKSGIQVIFDSATDTFYEQYDESLGERLVEEAIYYNRTADLELAFVNGVLMDHHDQPIRRRDKRYPFAKTGYQPFDEGKFFYFSSLAKNMSSDAEIIDRLYQMVIDGSFLQLIPPLAHYGDEEIDSDVIVPGRITSFSDKTKLETLNVGSNLNAGFAAIEKVEGSASESSNDVLQSGQSNGGSETAFEVSRLEQNARIMLGLFAKMIGFLVKQYGDLRVQDIVQFMTVGELMEVTGEAGRLKFQTFLLPDKNVDGKKKTRRIKFNSEMPDTMTDEERLSNSFGLLRAEGGLDSDVELVQVNPQVFRNLKFKCIVRAEAITPPSDNMKRVLNLELYDRAISSPFADQEALYRDLLLGSYEGTRDNVDKYVSDQPAVQPEAAGGQQESVLGKLLGRGPTQDLNRVV